MQNRVSGIMIGLATALMASFLPTKSGAQQADARVMEIAKSYSEVLNKCPNRLWSGLNWKDFEIVLVDSRKKQAWIWAGAADLSAIDYSGLGPDYTLPRYNFTTRNGKRALVVSLSDTERSNRSGQPSLTDFAIQLGFHEGFHWFEQYRTYWPSLSTGEKNDRSELFPAESEPRYLRRMLLLALRDAFVGADQNVGLNAAAYWYEKWKSKYPQEAASVRGTDIAEGTAYYVEMIASGLSVVGCGSSESDLNGYLTSQIDRILNLEKPMVIKVLESYEVGALAVLNLRKMGAEDWQNKIVRAQTPLEVLLSNRSAAIQKDDLSLATRAKRETDQVNAQVERVVKPTLDKLRSSSYTRVSYPLAWSGGAISHQGEFLLKDEGGLLVDIHAQGRFVSPDGKSSFEVNDTALIEGLTSPCDDGPHSQVALVETAVVSGAGTTMAVHSEGLKASGIADLRVDGGGHQWLCFR